MQTIINELDRISCSDRISRLRTKMKSKPRFLSIEQARIITQTYKDNEAKPTIIKRALALSNAMNQIAIEIDPDELIVGNRAVGAKTGVVSPEGGISWLFREIDILPTRPQDKFQVRDEDKEEFRSSIFPYWKGLTLEDKIQEAAGEEIGTMSRAVKINQKDHAQGHICPSIENWLHLGAAGLKQQAQSAMENASPEHMDFYQSVIIVLDGAIDFMKRYAALARQMAEQQPEADKRESLLTIADNCALLAEKPPETYHQAVQAIWFLFVLLEAESNASSFSPGRVDQFLLPYFQRDMEDRRLSLEGALEIMEAMWIKFNEIVYMRNTEGAAYFAGFPIGFNIAIGGQDAHGEDAANAVSYIILKAQEHLKLPQPNLSARIHQRSPKAYIRRCAEVIRLGTGLPQIFNDESVIPALRSIGIPEADALNYAVVGCVEISTHGNNLGWSDAAMVNLVKILELTLNNGICMQTSKRIGIDTGNLTDYETFEDLEQAYEKQIKHYIERMHAVCEIVEEKHIEVLPSPFLSAVIDDCIEKGVDVTAGGAQYNFSGIQIIQAANMADSFAALKSLVYDQKLIDKAYLLKNLREDYPDEQLRLTMLNKAPKYGNDVEWVDLIAHKWVQFFSQEIKHYKNFRGGEYSVGLYTVSAHVPMGKNVGATPDGRKNGQPLADGGLSAVYGRDKNGPTALLNSVNRAGSEYGTNGTLLNMKFSSSMLKNKDGFDKFCMLLESFAALRIHHVQFNVLNRADLIEAKKHPENYANLLVRVAGYSAYFVELSDELQNEIIARTEFGME